MIRVEQNKEHKGVEVYFDTKPQASIITALKEKFFRWHTAKKCWYAKATDENLQFIKNLLGNTTINTEQAPAPEKTQLPQSQYKYSFNGIKTEEGEYIKAHYDINKRTLEIELYLNTYDTLSNLPKGTRQRNESDGYTDYFEKTAFYITPASKEYLPALEGYKKYQAHQNKKSWARPLTEEQQKQEQQLLTTCENMAKLFITDEEKAQEEYNKYIKEQEEKQRQEEEQTRINGIKWLIESYQKEKNGEKQFLGNKQIFENDTYIIALEKQEHYLIDFTPNCMDKPHIEYHIVAINKITYEREHKTFDNEKDALDYIKQFIKD